MAVVNQPFPERYYAGLSDITFRHEKYEEILFLISFWGTERERGKLRRCIFHTQ